MNYIFGRQQMAAGKFGFTGGASTQCPTFRQQSFACSGMNGTINTPSTH
jgi:hypothetical protein